MRIVLSILTTICAAVYLTGTVLFRTAWPQLAHTASTLLTFPSLPWLHAASAASLIGSLCLILVLSGGRVHLPRRQLVLPLLFVVATALLINDVLLNASTMELDHIAAGILRYDEDSLPLMLLLLPALPLALALCGLAAAPPAKKRHGFYDNTVWLLSAGLSVLFLLIAGLCLIGHLAGPFYDEAPFHPAQGAGALILCLYACACLVYGRPTAPHQ